MVDFIRIGLLELCGSRVEHELQNVKSLPTVGFEHETFRLRIERATSEIRGLMSIKWLKVCWVLPECPIFKNLSVARGRSRCSKLICCELHYSKTSSQLVKQHYDRNII